MIEKFYTNYLKYYLNNPEKPHLKNWFFLSFTVMMAVNMYLVFISPGFMPSLIAGGAISIVMLVIAFCFGYLGLMLNILFSVFAIAMTIRLWLIRKEPMFLSILTFQIAVITASLLISYLYEKERKKQKRLELLSQIDDLTEAYNHRCLQRKLDEQIERALRNNSLLGLVMVDIDNFKKYNDLNGHRAGDEVLKKACEFLQANVRKSDLVFRYDGDEFAILVTDFDKANDISRFEEIVKSFGDLKIPVANDHRLEHLTLSMGLSVYPDGAVNKDELIKKADNALYMAKNTGRNRIQFYQDVLTQISQFTNMNTPQVLNSLKVLLATISVKDKYTLGHSERVSNYVVRLSTALGLTEEEINENRLAALLHDIGKIEIAEDILNKKVRLSEDEMALIKKHPVYSAAILEPVEEIEKIISSVKHHHEKYDGSGYPDGLAGADIPLGARILCVADAFDAMLSDRPYRKGMQVMEAVQQLLSCSGTQFDPRIVSAFIEEMEFSR